MPALAAGVAVTHTGLFPAAYGHGVGVIALTGVAVPASLRGRRRTVAAQAATAPLSAHHELPPCPGASPTLAEHR